MGIAKGLANMKAKCHGWFRNMCENDPNLSLMVEVDEHGIDIRYVFPGDIHDTSERFWEEQHYVNGNIYAFDNVSPIKIDRGTGGWRSTRAYATFMQQRVIQDMYAGVDGLEHWLKMILPVAIVGLVVFGLVVILT